MDVHATQPTWAGRVKNGIKNIFEYNKDVEITCKLTKAKDIRYLRITVKNVVCTK